MIGANASRKENNPSVARFLELEAEKCRKFQFAR